MPIKTSNAKPATTGLKNQSATNKQLSDPDANLPPNMRMADNGTFEEPSTPGVPLTLDIKGMKARKGDRTQSTLSPSSFVTNGSHLKTSPTTPPPPDNVSEAPLDDYGRRLIRRSSVILSSGWDKYTFDSETVEPPVRSIDVYEKQLSSHTNGNSSPSARIGRTASQVSSLTAASDQTSDRSDGSTGGEANGLPSTVSSERAGSRCIKRNSVVQNTSVQKSVLVNGRFQNPWDTWAQFRLSNILRLGLAKDKSNIPNKEQLDIVLPIVKPHLDETPPVEGVRVTWLGHSTVVVQMDGLTFITDPIFSDRASPSQVIGPKRYRDPPCTVHDLPSVMDAVIVSHNHYDHLDLNSVTVLNARYGSDLRWFVPLGLGEWMQNVGCDNVVELDWWEENCVPEKSDVSFVFTPAQHWSKRTLNDDNKSLWGSWCVIGPNHRFFFTGDTGYCTVFKEIGRVYGPFTVAAIPIGAFEPRWFMKYQHVDPAEAVQIHQDIGSQFSFGIHWGTFALANEYYLEPPVKLRESLEKKDLSRDSFVTFKHGETRLVKTDGTSVADKPRRKQRTERMEEEAT